MSFLLSLQSKLLRRVLKLPQRIGFSLILKSCPAAGKIKNRHLLSVPGPVIRADECWQKWKLHQSKKYKQVDHAGEKKTSGFATWTRLKFLGVIFSCRLALSRIEVTLHFDGMKREGRYKLLPVEKGGFTARSLSSFIPVHLRQSSSWWKPLLLTSGRERSTSRIVVLLRNYTFIPWHLMWLANNLVWFCGCRHQRMRWEIGCDMIRLSFDTKDELL